MSLAIVFKGTEGIVLAVDSRVTLTVALRDPSGQIQVMPSTFDNATKFLRIKDHDYVAAVTYGVGAIGQKQPRTAHSFIPEFEEEIKKELAKTGEKRFTIKEFANRLGQFFLRQWTKHDMPKSPAAGQVIVFYVAGYDVGEAYGRVYELHIPTFPEPKEWHYGDFGIIWGGQKEFVERLILGYDSQALQMIQDTLKASPQQIEELHNNFKNNLQAKIPFQFLPLQDCVNLAILLLRATMTIQTFTIGIRAVGGAIDVATITRTEGLRMIQTKSIGGESIA